MNFTVEKRYNVTCGLYYKHITIKNDNRHKWFLYYKCHKWVALISLSFLDVYESPLNNTSCLRLSDKRCASWWWCSSRSLPRRRRSRRRRRRRRRRRWDSSQNIFETFPTCLQKLRKVKNSIKLSFGRKKRFLKHHFVIFGQEKKHNHNYSFHGNRVDRIISLSNS